MPKSIIVIKFTFCLLILSGTAFSQSIKIFSSSNSNLPSGEISKIVIDNNGLKWLAVGRGGLFTFDGKKFTPYTPAGIRGDHFEPVFKDSKGNIWFSYRNRGEKLAKFNGKIWQTFSEQDNEMLAKSIITAAEDNTGKIYFGTSSGVVIYDGKLWRKLTLPKESIYQYTIRSIDINKKGHIAIGYNSGLLLYDGKLWQSMNENNSKLQLNVVTAVKYAPNGELYIGYGGGFGNGGFSILSNNKWEHYNTSNSALPDQYVRTIQFDNNGTIWMATNNGVVKIKSGKISAEKFTKDRWEAVLDIAIENNTTIWLADAAGLVRYGE
jgi:ligand-binding sensor domain-containing protein